MLRLFLATAIFACVNAQVWQIPLTLNSPYRVSPSQWLLPGQTGQFELTVPASEIADPTQDIKLTVTSLGSEEQSFYADFRQATPSSVAQFKHDAISKADGDMPVIFVKNTDFIEVPPYKLWITVECLAIAESACYFTMSASSNARAVLWPGFQLGDKVKKNQVSYFEFKPQWFNNVTYPAGSAVNASIANNDIQITLVPVRGRFSVYILAGSFAQNTRPSRTNFKREWSQEDYNNEVILIERGAPGRPAANSFVIAVFYDRADTVDREEASFYIQGTFRAHGQGQLQQISWSECRWLTPDVPVPSQSVAGGGDDEWEQLCFVHMGNNCSFDVALTVISGEQDLALWYDGRIHEMDAGVGSDNIHMSPEGMKFFALIVLTRASAIPGDTDGYGQYNVMYTKTCPTQNRLMNSQHVNSSVLLQIEQDMEASHTGIQQSLLTQMPEITAEIDAIYEQSVGTPSHIGFSSDSMTEEEAIAFSQKKGFLVKQDDKKAIVAPQDDIVDESHSFHTLSTNKTKLTYVPRPEFHASMLTSGQAQYGEATLRQIIRYVYHPYTYHDDFTFELIRNLGGNPDIYISTSNERDLPTSISYRWKSAEVGSDYVTVDKYDAYACVRRGCYYNIAVYIASQPEQYDITGYTLIASEGEGHTNLQNNVPYTNKLVAGEPDYLRFVVGNPGQTITIRLTDNGRAQPRMFVSTIHKFPNATFSEWNRAVTSSGASVLLTIDSEMPNYCVPTRTQPCIYWIGVTSGNTQNTTYTIQASAGGAVELRNGVYQNGQVRVGEMAQFYFQVTTGYSRFSTSVTLLSGQANYYIGNTVAPQFGQPTTYVASRTSATINSPITLLETSTTTRCTLVAGKCRYYIGVYGVNGGDDGIVRFSITGVTGERTSIGVQNGQVILSTLAPNETIYYYHPLTDERQRVQVCLTRISGSVTGYWSDVDDLPFPDASNFKEQWRVQRPGYGCIFAGASPKGQWYWSVANPSLNSTARISIVFLTQIGDNDRSSVVQLLDGTPSALYLTGSGCDGSPCEPYQPNPLVYFNFPVDRVTANFEVSLFNIIGETDLYMNYIAPNAQTRWPNATVSDYRSAVAGSDVIRIPNARAGRYLGVVMQKSTVYTGSAAMITASTGITALMLQNNVPVQGFSLANTFRWYQFIVTDPNAEVFVDLVPDSSLDDPDIYANPGASLSFNQTSAAWSSARAGGQTDTIHITRADPKRPTSATWTLSIGIWSFGRDSSYTVTARMSNNYLLEMGIPVSGTVKATEYSYYAFRPRSLTARIDVTLQVTSGTARMMISNNWAQPTISNYTHNWIIPTSSVNTYIEMDPADLTDRPFMCQARGIPLAQCIYYVGIYAPTRDAQYSIRVDQPGTGTFLPDKVVMSGTLPARSTTYYYFANREIDSTVAFLLTPLTGEADMYASATNQRPSATNYTWKSDATGFDVIGIRPATDLYYYIAVVNPSSQRTDYTIVGKSYDDSRPGDGADTLYEGQPQNGFTAPNGYSYYRFTVSGVWDSMTITVDPFLGDPDVYVNTAARSWPNTTHYDWKSNNGGTQSDVVTIQDPPAGTLYIAVKSFGSLSSYYRITVTGAGRSTQIYSGTMYTRTIAAGKSDYFFMNVGALVPNASLVFSLTPETGDPDLYISDRYRYPNQTTANWTSSSTKMDVISIGESRGLRSGSYFVAVTAYGSQNATYHLMGRYGSRGTLTDGVPLSGVVTRGGINYFDISMPSGLEFIVSVLTNTAGAGNYAYLYMDVGDRDPTDASNKWQSINGQSKRQEIRISNPSTCTSPAVCKYRVGVAAPLDTVLYTQSFVIIAQSNRTVSDLTPSVPRTDTVPQGGYMHYRFNLNCARSAVSITLTPVSGNADLLVNRGPAYPLRSLNNVMFESNNTGSDVDRVQFDWNNPLIVGRNMAGYWYISVINEATSPVTYSIVFTAQNGDCSWSSSSSSSSSTGASSSSSSSSGGSTGTDSSSTGGPGPLPGFTALYEGVPISGEIVRGGYLYYSFSLPSLARKPWPYTVYFGLVPLLASSDPDIFVRKDLDFPARGHSQWQSISAAGRDDMVSITPTSNPAPCNPTVNATCIYTIAVFAAGTSGDVTDKFSIVASTSAPLYGLELDHTLSSRSVGASSWYYYVVNVNNVDLPLVTILTPLSGNPDLYVEFGQLPTFNSPTSKTFGVDIVTINPVRRGVYYIGVYGEHTSTSQYSIVTSQRGIELQGGLPQGDVLSIGQQRFYYFNFKAEYADNVAFNLQLDAIAFNPLLDIYVRSDNRPLTPDDATWKIESGATWPLSLTVPRGVPGYTYNGVYRILVVSRSDNAAFAITASKGDATPITLTNGRPVDSGADALPSNAFRYYRVYVSNTQRELVWSLSMTQGSASLFLSPDSALPGPGNSKYSNATLNNPSLVIRVPKEELRVGWYYAAVRADWTSIRYTIAASTGSTLVQVGDSQHIQCSAGTSDYVLYLPWKTGAAAEIINFYATPNDWTSQAYIGNVQMYITTDPDVLEPDASNAKWTTTKWNWETPFSIGKWDVHLQACITAGNCQLNIAISCPAAARAVTIVLNVEVGSSLLPLLPSATGVFTQGRDLDTNQERHYTSAISRSPFSEIVLETCEGQTGLYVNFLRSSQPTVGDSDARSVAPNILHKLNIHQNLVDKRVFMTVRGASSEKSSYKLYSIVNNTWDDQSPRVNGELSVDITPFAVTRYQRITATVKTAQVPAVISSGRVRAPSGFKGEMRYALYYTIDGSTSESATSFTECGLQRSAHLVKTFNELEMASLYNHMTFLVPNRSVRYSVTVVASYWWVPTSGNAAARRATSGFIVYNTATNVRPGTSSDNPVDPEPESSTGPAAPEEASSVSWKIMLAFACVLVVVFAAVGYHYYKKNKNSVPVNNILGLDTDFSNEEGMKMRNLLDNEVDSSATSLQEERDSPKKGGPEPL